MPGDDDNMDAKRLKNSSQCSLETSSISNTSIPSASNWRSEQKEKFNITFLSLKSETSSVATEFHSAEFVKKIIELFNLYPATKVKLRFGVADIVITRKVQGLDFMVIAFEIKGAAPYDIVYRDKCRTQLAAFLISMALDNDQKLQLVHRKRFGCQKLYEVLHIGLTPIFYRVDIKDSYIDAINASSFENIPELTINEFIPVEPYNDREFLNEWSRPILMKSFHTLLRE